MTSFFFLFMLCVFVFGALWWFGYLDRVQAVVFGFFGWVALQWQEFWAMFSGLF